MSSSANSVEQGARLEKLLKSLKLKQLSFAQAVGISQGFLAMVISGKKNISYGTQNKILIAFPQVNLNWLLTGEGEMLLEKNAPAPGRVEEAGERYEQAPAAPEPPPLVVTDVTPLLEMMNRLRDEMQAREAEMKERVEWLERRVKELEEQREVVVAAL